MVRRSDDEPHRHEIRAAARAVRPGSPADVAALTDRGRRMKAVADAFHATTFAPGTNLAAALRSLGVRMDWERDESDVRFWTVEE